MPIETPNLHIGPGPHDAGGPGWVLIDADPARGEVTQDFNKNPELPFPDYFFAGVYGSHVFEHVRPWQCRRLFAEIHRVLMVGGVFRLVIPDVQASLQAYMEGRETYPLFKRRRQRAKQRDGLDLTLFEAFREDLISHTEQPDLFGPDEFAHCNGWDRPTITKDLQRAGFAKDRIRELRFGVTDHAPFRLERTYPGEAQQTDRSFYMEATKTGRSRSFPS